MSVYILKIEYFWLVQWIYSKLSLISQLFIAHDAKYLGRLATELLNYFDAPCRLNHYRIFTESLDFIGDFDDGQIMLFLCKTFHMFYADILYVFWYINEYLGNIHNIYD